MPGCNWAKNLSFSVEPTKKTYRPIVFVIYRFTILQRFLPSSWLWWSSYWPPWIWAITEGHSTCLFWELRQSFEKHVHIDEHYLSVPIESDAFTLCWRGYFNVLWLLPNKNRPKKMTNIKLPSKHLLITSNLRTMSIATSTFLSGKAKLRRKHDRVLYTSSGAGTQTRVRWYRVEN